MCPQAIDRVHRIGQTLPVRVIRLAMADTVEEKILAMQESKRDRSHATLGDSQPEEAGARARNARLSESELRRIFLGGAGDDE